MNTNKNVETNNLPLHITDESNGVTYTLHGDYYFPDITVPDNQYLCSRFGLAYLDHLKEHHPILLTGMLADGTLNEHLRTIDQQAQNRFDTLMKGYIRCWNITDELKMANQMKWVGLMNNARMEAERNVFEEIIYT